MPLFKSKSLFLLNRHRKEKVSTDISSTGPRAVQTISLPNISVMTSRFVDEFPVQFRLSSKTPSVPATPKLKAPEPKPSPVSPSPTCFSSKRAYWESVARQSPAASSPSPNTKVRNVKDRIADFNIRLATPESALKHHVGNIRNKITHLKDRLSTSEADNEKLALELDRVKSIAYQPTESRATFSSVSCVSQNDKQLTFEVMRLQALVDQLKKDYHDIKVVADNNGEELRKFKTSHSIEEAKSNRLEKTVESTKQDCQNLLLVKELQLVQANRFITALTSINLGEPVLKHAHIAMKNGKEADAALVASIKEAAKKSDTPWATIIPAVVGERPSDLYLNAIQRCAKLEALLQESEKKRFFWKMKAKAHRWQTVTPSSSSLSLVLSRLESHSTVDDDNGETSDDPSIPVSDSLERSKDNSAQLLIQQAKSVLCPKCSAPKVLSHNENTELTASLVPSAGSFASSQEHSIVSEDSGEKSASPMGALLDAAAENVNLPVVQAWKDSSVNLITQTNVDEEKVLAPVSTSVEIASGSNVNSWLRSTNTNEFLRLRSGVKKPLGNSMILNVSPTLKQTVVRSIEHVQKSTSNPKKDKVRVVSSPVSGPPQHRTSSVISPTGRKTNTTTLAKRNLPSINHSSKRDPPLPPTGIRRETVSSERKSVYFDEATNHPKRINKQERKTAFESPPTPMPPSTGRFSSPGTPTPMTTHRKIFDHGRKAVKSIAKLIT